MGAITTGLAGAGVDVGTLETQEDNSERILEKTTLQEPTYRSRLQLHPTETEKDGTRTGAKTKGGGAETQD